MILYENLYDQYMFHSFSKIKFNYKIDGLCNMQISSQNDYVRNII